MQRTQEPSTACAASSRAIGDCTILEISSEKLQGLLATHEVLHQRMPHEWVGRLNQPSTKPGPLPVRQGRA